MCSGVDTILFPDPVPLAQAYLRRFFPEAVIASQRPDDGDYVPSRPLILVRDGGGGLIDSLVYREKRLVFDVRCEDADTASDLASRVDAVIRAWVDLPWVVWIANLSAPFYDPDPDDRIPAFTWAAEIRQRGTKITLNER